MPEQIYSHLIHSPIGVLKLQATVDALKTIRFIGAADVKTSTQNLLPILQKAKQQLNEYFKRSRTSFSIPLDPAGTDFEHTVWEELAKIPYGARTTYGALAEKLGDSKKVRAVGRANGQNPIPIIIPCHRVIGSGNKLTGYAGGIRRKQWLLKHEGVILL